MPKSSTHLTKIACVSAEKLTSATQGRTALACEDGVNGSIARVLAACALDRFAHQAGDDGALIRIRECCVERIVHVVGDVESDSGHCANFIVLFETLSDHTLASS